MSRRPTVVVIAKEPLPGRVKTRLTPPFSAAEAAALAEAALADTLTAVATVPGIRRMVALDGRPGPWLPPGFDVVAQRRGGLGARLAGAFEDAGPMTLLLGMDTPQLSAALIEQALAALDRPRVDAVLGPAPDGGYWAIGLREPDPRVFDGVPMSAADTVERQRERLRTLGLHHVELRALRDIDTAEDAAAVAGLTQGSRFAATFGRLAPAR